MVSSPSNSDGFKNDKGGKIYEFKEHNIELTFYKFNMNF